MKRQVVAIDCDGVLVDNKRVWDRYFEEGRCGTKHPLVYDPADWERYPKICKKCWNAVLYEPELLYVQQPRPDAQYMLPILAKQFDLWMITSRHESTAEVTKNWLFWNGLYQHFTGMVFTQDKRTVCESIGAFCLVEDAEKNIRALEGSSVHPIIWNFPYNYGLSGIRVNNWQEAASAIVDLATGYTPTE